MRKCPINPPLFKQFGKLQTRIAVKQAYYRNPDTNSIHLRSVNSQIRHLILDILCIQWASALLSIVYQFIDSELEKRGNPCPLDIPPFRFVRVALAISSSESGQHQDAYLLEELIEDSTDGPWRKYINNNSAAPILHDNEDDQLRGAFLAFCQHVQYWKTSKAAFVTDFQGV